MNPASLAALLRGDLANALTAANPGGIEAQKARWQAELVASANMPIDMSPSKSAFEAVGFVFGEPVDDLFVSATLPPGWTKKGTDHSMWSSVLDETGAERVSIFYKAAFYDRSARATLRAPQVEAKS